MSNINALIIGLGSAGTRHARNLKSLGVKNIFSISNKKRRKKFNLSFINYYKNLNLILKKKEIHIAIISNPSSKHLSIAKILSKKKIDLFIEKPLSHNLNQLKQFKKIVKLKKIKVAIGCQLRFHLGLLEVKKILDKKKLGRPISVSADVGEYLPNWHPYENYKKSYVSKKKLGGGVILTLIHEIDYLFWLFGKFKSFYTVGKKTNLKIETEDNVCCLLQNKDDLPIQLRMDLWRKNKTRKLNIVFEHGQIDLDLIKNKLQILNLKKNKSYQKKFISLDLHKTIMKYFLNCVRSRSLNEITSLEEAEYVLKTALRLKQSLK